MDLGLDGKIALVTGATAGIGLATAGLLHDEGASVVVCGRDPQRLERAVAGFGDSGRCHGVVADVADAAALEALHAAALARFGGLDILVNNAGGSARGHALEVDDDGWRRDLDLKLMAHVRLARIVTPTMRRRGGGAIVNVANTHARHPGAGSAPTSVSRAAGLAFAKALSRDVAADGIRVNTVCIGVIRSEQHDRRWRAQAGAQDRDEYYRGLAAGRGVPLGRAGEAEEAAAAIAFLASDAASYITGVALNVDGGSSHVS